MLLRLDGDEFYEFLHALHQRMQLQYTTQRAYAYDGLGQIYFVKLHWAAGNPAGLEQGVWEKEVKLIY